MRHLLHGLSTLLLTATGALSGTVQALPLDGVAASTADAVNAGESGHEGVDFSGIVALDDCSGSLVRFTSSAPGDKALVLTNGHCYEGGLLNSGQVLPAQGSSRVFNLLTANGLGSLGSLYAEALIYGTMTDTDVILYRLTQTYAEIKSMYGVDPLTIAAQHPRAGTPIRIVSGYWKKIYSCSIDSFVFELKEDQWLWKDSIRYKEPGCSVISGTSGSPIIDPGTRELIGVNNTINTVGYHCMLNNPCEVDANGQETVREGTGYGQEVYLFYGCLGAGSTLNLDQPGCRLPKPGAD